MTFRMSKQRVMKAQNLTFQLLLRVPFYLVRIFIICNFWLRCSFLAHVIPSQSSWREGKAWRVRLFYSSHHQAWFKQEPSNNNEYMHPPNSQQPPNFGIRRVLCVKEKLKGMWTCVSFRTCTKASLIEQEICISNYQPHSN